MNYRPFGKTGEKVSALGFGCMRFPQTEEGKIDRPRAIQMLRSAIDNGVNYVDTAYFYHGGESEVVVGEALKDGYREKILLADKMPLSHLNEDGDFERIFEEQRTRLGVEVIDFYLMHAVNKGCFEKMERLHVIEKMEALKRDGKVRHIGFSFHDTYEVFHELLGMLGDEWEFCQIQYNYLDTDHQAGQKGLEEAAARGFGVVIMEPLLGGRLANPPEHIRALMPQDISPVEYALDFIWDQSTVSLLLSGMSTEQQVADNLTFAARSATGMLNDAQRENYRVVKAKLDEMPLVPCTKCRYCMPCSFGVDIPGTFAFYNSTFGKFEQASKKRYAEITEGRADLCRKCGKCEKACPQHLPIRDLLARIHTELG